MQHLRNLGNRRIGGILVPFNLKDGHKTTFKNGLTDFQLDMYPSKPLFAEHTLRSGTMGRAGVIDQSAFKFTAEGLYAEADVLDNEYGNYVLTLIDSQRGYWSAGTMPHQLRVSPDGTVTLFPIVEGSVVSNPSSPMGSTTVKHLRSFMQEIQGEDEMLLPRSPFVSTVPWRAFAENAPPAPAPVPAVTPPPAPDPNLRILERLDQMQQSITDLSNLRQLPASNFNPAAAGGAPRIEVSSRFDGVSALGMLFWDRVRQLHAARNGNMHIRSEEFLRALGDKIARAFADEDNRNVPQHLRSVDSVMADAWRAKAMPNLRSNELMQATLAASGDELVPTSLNSVAWYSFMLASKVAALFDSFVMPSNPFDYPTISGGPTIRRVLEATDQSQANLGSSTYPASKPTTGKKTFNCLDNGIGALVLVSNNLFLDSGIAIADMLATQWARNMAQAIDYVVINGDESATATNISHYGVDPTNTAYDKILILDGLRHIAVDNSDTRDAGSLAAADYSANQGLMGSRGRIGTDLANLVHIIDPGVWFATVALSDFATFNQVGASAALLTGQVGNVYGVPLIVSDEMEYMTADQNRIPSTHDATAGDTGGILTVHRMMVKIGRLREINTEFGPIPHTGMLGLSGSVRLDVQSMEAGSVAAGYGVTTTVAI